MYPLQCFSLERTCEWCTVFSSLAHTSETAFGKSSDYKHNNRKSLQVLLASLDKAWSSFRRAGRVVRLRACNNASRNFPEDRQSAICRQQYNYPLLLATS